ncbi:MAG: rod shape-determining protein MreC [Candidatus Methylacidiphilales bacterium]
MARSFYITGAVLAVFCFLGALALPKAVRTSIQQASANFLSPAWSAVDWVRSLHQSALAPFRNAAELSQEVERLRIRNAELETEAKLLARLEDENNRLREMLGFKRASPLTLVGARVIGRDVSNWWNSVIINRGFGDGSGIEPDAPVVTPRGVVGKIGTVSRFTSQVILVVDPSCRISAVTESSKARGIVEGTSLDRGDVPSCAFLYVDRSTPFAAGERVFTTGLGGIFPANLLIGTIAEAPPLSPDRNFGLYREGTIEPAVDLNNLDEVFVIVSPEP